MSACAYYTGCQGNNGGWSQGNTTEKEKNDNQYFLYIINTTGVT